MMEWTREPNHWKLLAAIDVIMIVVGLMGALRIIQRRRIQGPRYTAWDSVGHMCLRLAMFLTVWVILGMKNPPVAHGAEMSPFLRLDPVSVNGVCTNDAVLLVRPISGREMNKDRIKQWGEVRLRREVLTKELVRKRLPHDWFWNPDWRIRTGKPEGVQERLLRRFGADPDSIEIQFTAVRCE
ncbi:MAG: hypothetical protein AAB420_01620 [Patescibacteria group bacterium]